MAIRGSAGTDRRPAVHPTHQLELTVADTPLVLDRIVSLCRSRQCTIVALRYEAAGRHRTGRVALTVAAPSRRARLVAAKLEGLVGVRSVEHAGPAAGREGVEMHGRGVSHPGAAVPLRSYGGG
jgi:acetolactate synthase regulatory subunit